MKLSDVADVLTVPGNPRVVAISGSFLTPGSAIWFPLFPLYLLARGVSPIQIGIVFAAGTALTLLSSLAGGWAADRWGRKHVILLAGALSATGMLVLAILTVPYFETAVASYGLVMFGSGLGRGPMSALLYESATKRKGASQAAPYFLPSMAAIPMPFIGALMVAHLGLPAVFATGAALTGVAVALRALGLTDSHPGRSTTSATTAAHTPKLLRWELLAGPIAGITLLYAILAFSSAAYSPFMPLFFTQVLGSSVAFFGLLASIGLGIAGVLSFSSGWMVDRLGSLRTMGWSFVGEAFFVTGLVLVRNLILAGILYESWDAVDWLDQMAPAVFIGDKVDGSRRATAMSIFTFATSVPRVFAAGFGGVLFEWNPYSLLVLEAILSVACAIAVFEYLAHVRVADSVPGALKAESTTKVR